ncbi:MAG: hypothetical protein IT306_03215 [Chloroflexi bacterium]|nr:hypothetical protein [Chloroflexota bacterium]
MRAAISLDGVWDARLDPTDAGVSEGWFAPTTPFDRRLTVPLPWQAADPSLRGYAGVVWYRRAFDAPAAWQAGSAPAATPSVALHFGAVDYAAEVWLNGTHVGGHEGGYTPFACEVGAALRWDGPNVVAVRVFDPADVRSIPHGKQGGRWYTPISGPWQPVSLVARPAERIGTVRCEPDGIRGTVRVTVSAVGLSGPRAVNLEIRAAGSDAVVATARAVVASAQVLVGPDAASASAEIAIPDPRRWEPDRPHLYAVRATLGPLDRTTARHADAHADALDTVEECFGLRTVEVRDGTLLLNGQPLYLRGALDQAYWPDTLYTAPSDAEIEREIRLAKDLGFNMLRKHIKPEDPRYLDAADRLGLLIWAEPANPARFDETARAGVRRDLLATIERDFNHPSVVIWSLYNEDWGITGVWDDAEKQQWVTDLFAEVKRIDPTRPVCDNSGWAHVVTDLNDYHEYYATPERIGRFRERLDFILAHPDDNFAQGFRSNGEPILVSEFGNWAVSDPADARARSGGQAPPWFHFDQGYNRVEGLPPPPPGDPLVDRIRTVAGFEERWRTLGLEAVFGTTEGLIAHLQRRAVRALKAQIGEMRRRPAIQGYVVTEFTDIEWEGNGWLDYWRRPKPLLAELAQVNGDVAVIATAERPNVWRGETATVRVAVSNTTATPISGTIRWQLDGSPEDAAITGEQPVEVWAHAVDERTVIRFRVPAGAPRTARLRIGLVADGRTVTRTEAELAFAAREDGLARDLRANGSTLERVFRQRLERQGFQIGRGFDRTAPLAVTNRLDSTLLEYLHGGGRVLFVASTSAEGADAVGLRFNVLSPGESWRMAAGAAWARTDLLAPAPLLPELGWEVADIFPSQAIDAGAFQPGDLHLAGWFEGWLANAGSLATLRTVGQGRLLTTTFRFEDRYGLDPVATLLLNRLARLLLEA